MFGGDSQIFFKFTSFYQRFIQGFAKIDKVFILILKTNSIIFFNTFKLYIMMNKNIVDGKDGDYKTMSLSISFISKKFT